MRQNVGLALGRGGAVAAHGGKQEGPRAFGFPEVDRRPHDGGDVADAPAAHANRDARPGLQPTAERRTGQFLTDRPANIAQAAIGKVLANQQKAGKVHETNYSEVGQVFPLV